MPIVFKAPVQPLWLLLGSSMLMDPHPSQQHTITPPIVFPKDGSAVFIVYVQEQKLSTYSHFP